MNNKTVVFILSEKHSGSTWLSFVLGSHSKSANLGEYYRAFIDRNQIECNVCRAKGLDNCSVLHGIQDIPVDMAYAFAFERFGKEILIDAGKEISWANKILSLDSFQYSIMRLLRGAVDRLVRRERLRVQRGDHYQYKVVHLVRDPRGWFASEKRRGKTDIVEAMARWVNNNKEIEDFISKYNLPSIIVFYDELASDPDNYFPVLCEFAGMDYRADMLEYWNHEHHGTAANGASFNVIGDSKYLTVKTADDKFYLDNARRSFYDQRWKEQLTREDIEYIGTNDMVKNYLLKLGRNLDDFMNLA